jgi:hypothetical protein
MSGDYVRYFTLTPKVAAYKKDQPTTQTITIFIIMTFNILINNT